jgi:dihydroxyacetone kinase phosphoprotein-dependent L subunit
MDAACGDGDFGSTMASAFERAAKAVEEASGNDIGALLMLSGTAILSSAGGASGPIFGGFLIEAGKTSKGKSEVALQDLATMFGQSLQRIKLLGGAELGDKTLVDALEPTVNALRESASAGVPLQTGLDQAAEAARRGCESTKEMIAKHGKARYLGEQTLGLVDPGAHLVSLAFATLADTARH